MLDLSPFEYCWTKLFKASKQGGDKYKRKVSYKNAFGATHTGFVEHTIPDMRHPEIKKTMREIDQNIFELYSVAIQREMIKKKPAKPFLLLRLCEVAKELRPTEFKKRFGNLRG